MFESSCGLKCSECEYREMMNCSGCIAINKPFWGDSCNVKSCCERRNHSHCGQCADIPCDTLNQFAYDKDQGDNGERIETCLSWGKQSDTIIDPHKITADEVISTLESESTLILATSSGGRVTIRPVSHVNNGLVVYFQTGKNYLKVQQIQANPNVALYVGEYQIEGLAKIIGHPLSIRNEFFIEKLKTKHNSAFEKWSDYPDEIVIKVETKLARRWQYIDSKPYIAIGQFEIQENTFDPYSFISAVVQQDVKTLPTYFVPDAVICWHDSNEQFTVDEYIQATCKYPDLWDGEIQRIEQIDGGIAIISKIFSNELTVFVNAFIKLTDGKISRLDEYYADYSEEIPDWRRNMKIGKPIKVPLDSVEPRFDCTRRWSIGASIERTNLEPIFMDKTLLT